MLLRQRWILGATAFLLVLVPLVGIVFRLPDVYRSASTILIEPQQISDDLVKSTVSGGVGMRLSAVTAQVLSRPSLMRLIRCFGLYDIKQSKTLCESPLESEDIRRDVIPERVIEQMRQDVTIGSEREDRVHQSPVAFTISYRGPHPQTVAEVVNVLTSSYILESEKMRSAQAYGTVNFLRLQLAEAAKRLQSLESTMGVFRSKHVGELPEQLEANFKTLEQLNTQLRENSESMIEATERRGTAEGGAQVKRLEAEAADLKLQIAVYQRRVEATPRVQQEFQPLAREYETVYEGYKSIAARLGDADLAAKMEDSQKGERFRVIERAMPSEDPVEPERARLYAWALVLALAAASLVVLVPGVRNRFGRGSASPSDDAAPPASPALT